MKKKLTIQVSCFAYSFLILDYIDCKPRIYICYFLVDEQTRSFNQNIEYVDEYSTEVVFNQMSESDGDGVGHKEAKGRRGILRIDATDKRPKCQPVGAQIDCR